MLKIQIPLYEEKKSLHVEIIIISKESWKSFLFVMMMTEAVRLLLLNKTFIFFHNILLQE